MATHSGSSSPVSGSPAVSPMSPTLLSLAAGLRSFSSPAETILFESYLYKTPPLKSFIMKWSKRWFVLSTLDTTDANSIQLSYYKDESKREARKIVDLSKFMGIRPSAKVGNHQHVFAIETKERKFILKAQDQHTKNIWLAKMCELFGQEQVCHVTIPQQPSCMYSEAILKLSCPSHLTAITPSTGSTILEVPFEEIRRLGSIEVYGTDIVWLETCKHSLADNFIFFTIPSGREMAQEVARDLKTAIESYTSVVLIMEVSNDKEVSFISRDHYGCPVFPLVSRNAILQSGLRQLPPCWQTFIMQERIRRESDSTAQVRSPSSDTGAATGGMSLDEWSAKRGRRKATSMKVITRRPTLDHFVRQGSLASFDRERSSPLSELSAGHFSDSQNEVFLSSPLPSTPPPHTSPCSRKTSLSQQNSSSSSTASPASHHRPHNHILSHQSSSSSLTTSTPSPPAHRQRKLSYQSSVSSHSSNNSLPPQAVMGSSRNSMSSLDLEESVGEEPFSTYISGSDSAPVVPPRSDVSLRETYYSSSLTAAH